MEAKLSFSGGTGSVGMQADARLLTECLKYADSDEKTMASTLQAIATACASSEEACTEFHRLGVLDIVATHAFNNSGKHAPVAGKTRSGLPLASLSCACREKALHALACAASTSDMVRLSLSREETLASVSLTLEKSETTSMITATNPLLSSLLGSGGGNTVELCWKKGIFQRLCDLFTSSLGCLLDAWDEDDSPADTERAISSIVSTLCMAMSCTNTSPASGCVQSMTSQLFPLCKVVVEKASSDCTSARDEFLCRLCKLLSCAVNENCANQDRFRISGALATLVQSLSTGFEQSAMSSKAIAMHLEAITASCSDNDVNKAYLCKHNVVSLYGRMLSHFESVSGGILATHLLLAILCIIDFNEDTVKAFVSQGAVPQLIRTVINSKDSDVHKAAVLILDIVNNRQQALQSQENVGLGVGKCPVAASPVWSKPADMRPAVARHANSSLEIRTCTTSASTSKASRFHPEGDAQLPRNVLTTPLIQSSEDGSAVVGRSYRRSSETAAPAQRSLIGTTTSASARQPGMHQPVSLPADQRRPVITPQRRSYTHGVPSRDFSPIENVKRHSTGSIKSRGQVSNHATTCTNTPQSVLRRSGSHKAAHLEALAVTSCAASTAEQSTASTKSVSCVICSMTKLGCVTSRSFASDQLSHSQDRLCAEHRASRWNLKEFAAVSSCIESDASTARVRRRSSKCTSVGPASDTSAVFEPVARVPKKRKLLSRHHFMPCADANSPVGNTARQRRSKDSPASHKNPQGTSLLLTDSSLSRPQVAVRQNLVTTDRSEGHNAEHRRHDRHRQPSQGRIQSVTTKAPRSTICGLTGADALQPIGRHPSEQDMRKPHKYVEEWVSEAARRTHHQHQRGSADGTVEDMPDIARTPYSPDNTSKESQLPDDSVLRSVKRTQQLALAKPVFPADLLDMSMEWRHSDTDRADVKADRLEDASARRRWKRRLSHIDVVRIPPDEFLPSLAVSKAQHHAAQRKPSVMVTSPLFSGSVDMDHPNDNHYCVDAGRVNPSEQDRSSHASKGKSQHRPLLSYRRDRDDVSSGSDLQAAPILTSQLESSKRRLAVEESDASEVPWNNTCHIGRKTRQKIESSSRKQDPVLNAVSSKIYPRFAKKRKQEQHKARTGVQQSSEDAVVYNKENDVLWSALLGEDESPTLQRQVISAKTVYGKQGKKRAVEGSKETPGSGYGLRLRNSNMYGCESTVAKEQRKIKVARGKPVCHVTVDACQLANQDAATGVYDYQDDGNMSCASAVSGFGYGSTKSGRRQRLPMEPWEITNLLIGVERLGHQWAHIRNSFPFMERRTGADLRTKFRQLQKSGALAEQSDSTVANPSRPPRKLLTKGKLLRL